MQIYDLQRLCRTKQSFVTRFAYLLLTKPSFVRIAKIRRFVESTKLGFVRKSNFLSDKFFCIAKIRRFVRR